VSWHTLAARDVRDAGRSRITVLLTALSAVLYLGTVVVHDYIGEPSFPAFVEALAGVVAVVLPAVAILLAYKSVVDERESGALFLTLSMPHSRKDVALGTFVGRTVVTVVPTLAALAVAGVVGAVRFGTAGALWFPWFLLATALYGTAFVGIAVGLSLSTTVDRWITVGGLGSYLLLVSFWDSLHSLVLVLLHRFDLRVLRDVPDWALFFRLLQPSESYDRLLRSGFDVDLAGLYVADGAPVYVGWWAALLVLCLWILAPLAVGYRRFRTADL
jgi:ABC-2 type transport system permease protein